MSENEQIFIVCNTHPSLCKPHRFSVPERFAYSPLSLEVSILQNVSQSTNCLKRSLHDNSYVSDEFDKKIESFLSAREKMLLKVSGIPEVQAFINYVLGLESEVQRELETEQEEENLEAELDGAIRDIEHVAANRLLVPFDKVSKHYDNLIDAMSYAIRRERKLKGKSLVETEILNYVKHYLETIDWLVEQRNQTRKCNISLQQLQCLLAKIISCDVFFIADEENQLETESSLLIPLDFSPVRLSLAILFSKGVDAKTKNWNRMFSPPLFLLWQSRVPHLVKPYRSLDKHPIMIRVSAFDIYPERFQEETTRLLNLFQESLNPVIEKIKGLTLFGKRGTQPSLIKSYLSRSISFYLQHNPFAIEYLKIVDLGCGSGGLLKDSYYEVLKNNNEINQRIQIYTLVNDITQEPGKALRNASETEDFAGKLQIEIRKGDMRELIIEAREKREFFDVAFINRVLDIYGGYGIFAFDKGDLEDTDFDFTVRTKEIRPTSLDSEVVAFPGFSLYTSLWRAMAFLFRQQLENQDQIVFLPAVEMNAIKNFLPLKDVQGDILFERLLDVASVLFVSVFPGSSASVFPLEGPIKERIHFREIRALSSYTIILASKDKQIVDYIADHIESE